MSIEVRNKSNVSLRATKIDPAWLRMFALNCRAALVGRPQAYRELRMRRLAFS